MGDEPDRQDDEAQQQADQAHLLVVPVHSWLLSRPRHAGRTSTLLTLLEAGRRLR
jgi:hypothetical protein